MYRLGKRSMGELVGVHPILSFAVTEAIKHTQQDFMVLDGVRENREQQKLVDRGVSKTLDSYHLYGLAVDLVAYQDGKPTWDKKYYEAICEAMKYVIKKYDLPIEWGMDKWGWDMPHWQLTGFKNTYDVRQLG
jgi:peptidoglycan L-alanyl-D-glutamate endopeptidase CwlK